MLVNIHSLLVFCLGDEINDIEEKIVDEKAELVAYTGVLDQNEKLKQEIREEERRKAKIENEKLLQEEREKLAKERELVRGSVENELASEINSLKTSLANSQLELNLELKEKNELLKDKTLLESRVSVLEDELSTKEVELEELIQQSKLLNDHLTEKDTRIEELISQSLVSTKASEIKIEELYSLNKSLNDQLIERDFKILHLSDNLSQKEGENTSLVTVEEIKKLVNKEKKELFNVLMEGFKNERLLLMKKTEEYEKLLADAYQDVLYLSKQNDELSRRK